MNKLKKKKLFTFFPAQLLLISFPLSLLLCNLNTISAECLLSFISLLTTKRKPLLNIHTSNDSKIFVVIFFVDIFKKKKNFTQINFELIKK